MPTPIYDQVLLDHTESATADDDAAWFETLADMDCDTQPENL